VSMYSIMSMSMCRCPCI